MFFFTKSVQFKPPGELGLERRTGRAKSKEDDTDTPLLYFSPALSYAGREEISTSKVYRDGKTERAYSAKVALMVEVQPGSYKVELSFHGLNAFLPDCKTTLSGIFTFFYANFKFSRPEHDCYAKFTSYST